MKIFQVIISGSVLIHRPESSEEENFKSSCVEDRAEVFRHDYCKFRNFRENFIFTNSVKRHICDVKICDYDMIYLHQ